MRIVLPYGVDRRAIEECQEPIEWGEIRAWDPYIALVADDFPLFAMGALVYRRTQSSPLFTAPNPDLAEELVRRLNASNALDQAMQRNTPTAIGVVERRDDEQH
jgi:hypothetical protein